VDFVFNAIRAGLHRPQSIKELNVQNNTSFYINNCLRDRNFRNCLAHYGLGQYISEAEIISEPDRLLFWGGHLK
jgi:hypothetical protein